eukprot:Gregarina_sp_Poly_1__1886@NODE_1490_length_4009_cov_50_583968_g986_i0_p1_GENE_NODE_1490_length_4009_cov_50_583968_g986_i0NODE_1490_length_4009_cov_50_583968_g986_i0_p1_ORF_typecomplete_len992_score165_10TAP_C/PF03943_13/8_7e05C2/PF00168_30/0_0019UBA_4/PF14555_6/0_069_NODE_1490_length_4009_cov_50_583968_g986_i010333810
MMAEQKGAIVATGDIQRTSTPPIPVSQPPSQPPPTTSQSAVVATRSEIYVIDRPLYSPPHRSSTIFNGQLIERRRFKFHMPSMVIDSGKVFLLSRYRNIVNVGSRPFRYYLRPNLSVYVHSCQNLKSSGLHQIEVQVNGQPGPRTGWLEGGADPSVRCTFEFDNFDPQKVWIRINVWERHTIRDHRQVGNIVITQAELKDIEEGQLPSSFPMRVRFLKTTRYLDHRDAFGSKLTCEIVMTECQENAESLPKTIDAAVQTETSMDRVASPQSYGILEEETKDEFFTSKMPLLSENVEDDEEFGNQDFPVPPATVASTKKKKGRKKKEHATLQNPTRSEFSDDPFATFLPESESFTNPFDSIADQNVNFYAKSAEAPIITQRSDYFASNFAGADVTRGSNQGNALTALGFQPMSVPKDSSVVAYHQQEMTGFHNPNNQLSQSTFLRQSPPPMQAVSVTQALPHSQPVSHILSQPLQASIEDQMMSYGSQSHNALQNQIYPPTRGPANTQASPLAQLSAHDNSYPQVQSVSHNQPLPHAQVQSMPQGQPLLQAQGRSTPQGHQVDLMLQGRPLPHAQVEPMLQGQSLLQAQVQSMPRGQPLLLAQGQSIPQGQPLVQAQGQSIPQGQPLLQAQGQSMEWSQNLPHSEGQSAQGQSLSQNQPLLETQIDSINSSLFQTVLEPMPQPQHPAVSLVTTDNSTSISGMPQKPTENAPMHLRPSPEISFIEVRKESSAVFPAASEAPPPFPSQSPNLSNKEATWLGSETWSAPWQQAPGTAAESVQPVLLESPISSSQSIDSSESSENWPPAPLPYQEARPSPQLTGTRISASSTRVFEIRERPTTPAASNGNLEFSTKFRAGTENEEAAAMGSERTHVPQDNVSGTEKNFIETAKKSGDAEEKRSEKDWFAAASAHNPWEETTARGDMWTLG